MPTSLSSFFKLLMPRGVFLIKSKRNDLTHILTEGAECKGPSLLTLKDLRKLKGSGRDENLNKGVGSVKEGVEGTERKGGRGEAGRRKRKEEG